MNLAQTQTKKFLESIASLPAVQLFYKKQRQEILTERAKAFQDLAKIAVSEKERSFDIAERRSKAVQERDTLDRALVKANAVIGELYAEENAFLSKMERLGEPHLKKLRETCFAGIDDALVEIQTLLDEARTTARDRRFNPGPRNTQILVSNDETWHQRKIYLMGALVSIEALKLSAIDDADAEKQIQKIKDGIPEICHVQKRGEKWVLVNTGHTLETGTEMI